MMTTMQQIKEEFNKVLSLMQLLEVEKRMITDTMNTIYEIGKIDGKRELTEKLINDIKN